SPFSKGMAMRLSIHIGLIINVILAVGYSYNGKLLLQNLGVVIPAALSTILLFYILFRYNFYVIQIPNQKKIKFFIRSNVFSFLFAIGFSLTISYIMTLCVNFNLETGKQMFISITLMKDLMTALIVQLITFLIFSLYQNQQSILKNQKLIAENIRTRYEVLKNQVDPHFLFNSLNTLDGLISMDTERVHEYVQNLSAVFRYAIGNKSIITLTDELEFTHSYVELMKIRYGESLQVHFNVDEKYLHWYVMPISLQLLVENAIKHNVVSRKQPLTIHIESGDDDTLCVWNQIQAKKEEEAGEGIGLANLAERYKLLFEKEIEVSSSEQFAVKIPLIETVDKNIQAL
ncbi:MAG: hypothetical protein RIS29_2745, partial [Bacteroidota bacterium]